MSELALQMPSNYVDIEREEMEYVDGGGRICSVQTAGYWIDGAIIAISWALGLGSAVSAIKAGGAALVKKVGIRTARRMAQDAFRKACWFLSVGTIYSMVDFALTVSGSSIGSIAANFLDRIDAKRYSTWIEI
ncbi:hypothetical protein OSC52_06960 [Clostridium pasteurianum]|uniref:hypothetical protein n=1 Tax=Clostridium pasteurianum TaxID=1501 RepID=UPI002260B1F5|nr:hypothetical protein [Clostridium pasteurianum]UZW15572.1 hypothetical protein OSC52_06960 [Clostridium pasteurianum]